MNSPPDKTAAERILRMRIGFALRRMTGVSYDVDAMLGQERVLERRLALWRAAGSQELNSLLDRLEGEFAQPGGTGQPATDHSGDGA